ncbi:hypothetical protein LXL04_029364 [Taraxacum kok-saghyz]
MRPISHLQGQELEDAKALRVHLKQKWGSKVDESILKKLCRSNENIVDEAEAEAVEMKLVVYLVCVYGSTGDDVLKELSPNASAAHKNHRNIFHFLLDFTVALRRTVMIIGYEVEFMSLNESQILLGSGHLGSPQTLGGDLSSPNCRHGRKGLLPAIHDDDIETFIHVIFSIAAHVLDDATMDSKGPPLKEIVAQETDQLSEQHKRLSVRDLANKFDKNLSAGAKLSNEAKPREVASLEDHVLLKKLRDALEYLRGRLAGKKKEDAEKAISVVEALAVKLTQNEGELIQEKFEVKKLANFLKQASEDAKKLVNQERSFACVEIESAKAVVRRIGEALVEQERVSLTLGKQEMEEIVEEIQQTRRIRLTRLEVIGLTDYNWNHFFNKTLFLWKVK